MGSFLVHAPFYPVSGRSRFLHNAADTQTNQPANGHKGNHKLHTDTAFPAAVISLATMLFDDTKAGSVLMKICVSRIDI